MLFRSNRFSNIINQGLASIKNEIEIIKYKSKDLKETNYNLALTHIKKGNYGEAAFRFWLMTKFWPDFYEAYYKRAYCLYLNNKIKKAKIELQDFIKKDTPYRNSAILLLSKISNIRKNI